MNPEKCSSSKSPYFKPISYTLPNLCAICIDKFNVRQIFEVVSCWALHTYDEVENHCETYDEIRSLKKPLIWYYFKLQNVGSLKQLKHRVNQFNIMNKIIPSRKSQHKTFFFSTLNTYTLGIYTKHRQIDNKKYSSVVRIKIYQHCILVLLI